MVCYSCSSTSSTEKNVSVEPCTMQRSRDAGGREGALTCATSCDNCLATDTAYVHSMRRHKTLHERRSDATPHHTNRGGWHARGSSVALQHRHTPHIAVPRGSKTAVCKKAASHASRPLHTHCSAAPQATRVSEGMAIGSSIQSHAPDARHTCGRGCDWVWSDCRRDVVHPRVTVS